MRQADITANDLRSVMKYWEQLMDEADAGDLDELGDRPVWHLFEAEQQLIAAACGCLGMPRPRNVSFSCLDSIEHTCECEVVIFWVTNPASSLDPECFVPGVALRMSEYKWPGRDLITKREAHVKYVIWRMSLLKLAMDKEQPCISSS